MTSTPRNCFIIMKHTKNLQDFPGGPVVKNPPSHARDAGSIPGLSGN